MFINKDYCARSLSLPKTLSEHGPTFNRVIDLRLNRVGMGYLSADDRSPHGPVSWVAKEHNYVHPFSLKKRAFDYGFHQLKDLMPLETYLNLPADLLDDLIEGIREGSEMRIEKTPKTENKAPLDPTAAILSEMLKK